MFGKKCPTWPDRGQRNHRHKHPCAIHHALGKIPVRPVLAGANGELWYSNLIPSNCRLFLQTRGTVNENELTRFHLYAGFYSSSVEVYDKCINWWSTWSESTTHQQEFIQSSWLLAGNETFKAENVRIFLRKNENLGTVVCHQAIATTNNWCSGWSLCWGRASVL